MKGRFWALPGVAAMLGALALATTAEGVLSAREATLPRPVQLALPRSSPDPPAADMPSSDPTGGASVVAPSRPVVAQLSPANPAEVTNAAGAGPALAGQGTPQSDVAGENDGSGGAPSNSDGSRVGTPTVDDTTTTAIPLPTPESTTTTTTTYPTTTTTTSPTTTTTTVPRKGGEGGDE